MMHRRSLRVALLLPVGAAICFSGRAMAMSTGNPVIAGIYAAARAAMTGQQSHGYLGVDIRDVSEEQIAPLKLKEATGAEIIHIDHDGPAGKLGLREHDVILKINGQQIEGQEQFRRILRESPAGLSVTLVISRDGQQQTMTTQLANREEVERRAWEQHLVVPDPGSDYGPVPHAGNSFVNAGPSSNTGPKAHRDFLGTTTVLSPSFTGAQLEIMGPQLAEFFGVEGNAGLLVRSVEAHSPAEEAGIRAGDIILRLNEVAVTTGSEWSKTIRRNRGRPVAVVVLRNRHEQTMTMTPDGRKRSSVSPQVLDSGFFSIDGAAQAVATMAELSSELNSIEAVMQRRFESLRKPVELVKMTENAFKPNPEFQRRAKMVHKASEMMAEAAWKQFDMAEVRDRLVGFADRWMGHESICMA